MTDDGRNKLINEPLPVYEESLPTNCHNNVIEDPMTGLRTRLWRFKDKTLEV